MTPDLFCFVDRNLGLPQWANLGMYLQAVMLRLRAEGLHSCPQMAWSQIRKSVAEILAPPAELILFCGMSIGYEDDTVKYVHQAVSAEVVGERKASKGLSVLGLPSKQSATAADARNLPLSVG